MKTLEEIVNDCNKLAGLFYLMQGCKVDNNFKFNTSEHPTEQGMWNMAVAAYEYIEGTDVEQALLDIEDGNCI